MVHESLYIPHSIAPMLGFASGPASAVLEPKVLGMMAPGMMVPGPMALG